MRGRFGKLVQRHGLCEREAEIRRCFDLVCAESIAPGAGWSSLNADGVPVQFALSLAPGRTAAFEFIGESFRAGMNFPERRAFGLERMALLARATGLESELIEVLRPLEELTDSSGALDGEDPAGAFWMGASFEPAGRASMTVYVNGRRGPAEGRAMKLAAFAEQIAGADWKRVAGVADAGGLKPLGGGVRIAAQRTAHARIYFGAYGVKPDEYRRMFREAGAMRSFDGALATFFERILRDEATYPTRSAVFSFGSDGNGEWIPKLELCGHCAWMDDGAAQARVGDWLSQIGADEGLYHDVARILAAGSTRGHAFVGVGMRGERPYSSIYLNPGRGEL